MDLKAILAVLSGNKWIIILTTVITVMVVAVLTFFAMPIYMASTTIRVATTSSSSVSYQDYMYADRLMNTYTKLATSRPIFDELMTKIGSPVKPTIKVATIPNTELIRITAESVYPWLARLAADTLADILITQSVGLYSGGGKSTEDILMEQLNQAEVELNKAKQEYDAFVAQSPEDSERIELADQVIKSKEASFTTLLEQYDAARLKAAMRENTITIVEPAVEPTSPIRPRKALNLGLGLLLGFIGGIGLAFLFQNLDNRLYTSAQIEAVSSHPLIGKIPTIGRTGLLYSKNRDQHFKESFNRLRHNILGQRSITSNKGPLKTFLITSAIPGEGKSTIVYYLAKVMARSGQKVLVVDCDLHLPKQHKLFGLSNEIGLSNLLQQASLDQGIQLSQYPNLSVLTSGPIPENPAVLLGSEQMKALIALFVKQYDIILFDSPAVLAVADAAILAPEVEGVVLVFRRTVVKKDAVLETCEQLEKNQTRILGVVVNDAEQNGIYYYYGK